MVTLDARRLHIVVTMASALHHLDSVEHDSTS
jgi:hypothetical protein